MANMTMDITEGALPIADVRDNEIPVLDGVRGCLALWVMLGHTLYICGNATVPVLREPGIAVYAFMVMSGFLMTFHYTLREKREPWRAPSTWMMFYVRRYFRIAPLYYFALAIAFCFHASYMAAYYALQRRFPLSFYHTPVAIAPFDIRGLLIHVSFLFGLIPSQADNNILPDWSIGLEMQFYFLFPFIMIFFRAVRPFWCVVTVVVIGAVAHFYAPNYPQPSFLPLTLGPFMIGILLAEAWFATRSSSTAGYLALAMALAVIRMPFLFQIIVLGMILIINAGKELGSVAKGTPWRIALRFLGGDWGQFLGKGSYAVYLIHMLILIPLMKGCAGLPWFARLLPLERFAIAAPAMLLLSYGAAAFLYRIIEAPGIGFGREIVSRWRSTWLPMAADH